MDSERGLIIDDVLGGIQQKLSLEGTVLEQRASELKTVRIPFLVETVLTSSSTIVPFSSFYADPLAPLPPSPPQEAYKLARQRAFLREERRKAREDALANEQDKQEHQLMKREDWFPHDYLKGGAKEYKKVKINVGGQLFELSEIILTREPGSLLSALLEDDSPLTNGEEGVVHVDRDWWSFRHILKFLRDGVLPRDKEVLTMLYKEASFWRLRNLKYAIEEERLNLKRRTLKWDDKEGDFAEEEVKLDKWYKNLPNWWESAENRKKRRDIEKKYRKSDKKDKDEKKSDSSSRRRGGRRDDGDEDSDEDKDWWTGTEYKGRDYKFDDEEYEDEEEEEDENLRKSANFNTTWSTKGGSGSGVRGGKGGSSELFQPYGDYSYPGVGI
jgi:hypothetical protein